MKKALILLLLLVSGFQQLYAQQNAYKPNIHWGKLTKEPRSAFMNGIIMSDESGFYSYRYDSKKKPYYFIEQYDQQMIRKRAVGVDLKLDKKELDLEFFFQLKGKLYVFTSLHDRKQKTKQLYVQQIDKSSLLLVDKPRLLQHIDYSVDKSSKGVKFYWWYSADYSKFLIFYDVPDKEKTVAHFKMMVLDQELKPIWEKPLKLRHQDEDFSLKSWSIDNYGNVYLLGNLFHDETSLKKLDKQRYRNQLLRISNRGDIVDEHAVELPDHFLSNIKLGISPNQDVICAGFYSPSGTSTIKGSFFFSMDAKSGLLKNKGAQEFDKSFLTEGLKERKAEKTIEKIESGENIELNNFTVNNLSFREDGGVVLIGEYYDRYSYKIKSSPQMTEYHTNYYFYNIMVVSLNDEGKLEWAHQIAKKQSTEDDNGMFSSYRYVKVGDKLYFFFNDHPDNLHAEQGKVHTMKTFLSAPPLLVAVEMDSKGNQRRIPIESYTNSKVLFTPGNSYHSGTQLIIFGQKGFKERFALVTFK